MLTDQTRSRQAVTPLLLTFTLTIKFTSPGDFSLMHMCHELPLTLHKVMSLGEVSLPSSFILTPFFNLNDAGDS